MPIYVITNRINGKQYVGMTKHTIEERLKGHISHAKTYRSKFHNAIRKYGYENFIIEELEACAEIDLDEREKFWINELDTLANGYNSTCGGQKGFTSKHSTGTKEKLKRHSRQCSEETRKKISKSHETRTYKKASPETKQKMSDTRRKRYIEGLRNPAFSEKTKLKMSIAKRKAVNQYDQDGNLIATFQSQIEAAETTGVSNLVISRSCRGVIKSGQWKFVNQ